MAKASILTEADVRRLRDLASRRMLNTRQEALFYGVNAETIRRAVRGETWTNLSMSPPASEAEMEAAAASSLAKLQSLLAADKAKREAPQKMLDEIAAADNPFINRDLAKAKGYL